MNLKTIQNNPEIKKLLLPKWTKYIPIEPTVKQAAFLWYEGEDAFFGGAAGGGKSIALLAGALQYVDQPHYNAILLRDTFRNLTLPDSLLDVAHQWLDNTDANWNEDRKRFTFPSGATLNFGYLDGPRDHYNYQSAQFQYVGVDEAVAIRKEQALYLFSRMRTLKGVKIPLRFRAASNPPSREQFGRGAWVKHRYVDPRTKKPGVLFIPARMNDNPFLDQDGYNRSLENLDPITRAQLKDGNWELMEKGSMFDRGWFGLVDAAPVEGKTTRYWDLAATEVKRTGTPPKYTAGVKMTKSKDGIYYIETIVRFRKEPLYAEQMIRQTADIDGTTIPIYIEQEPGSSGKYTIDHYRRIVLPEFVLRADRVTGNKVSRAAPFSSQAEAGNVKLVKGHWNEAFLDEIELFPDGEYCDQVDAAAGAFDKLAPYRMGLRSRVIYGG